jgi:ABC-type branched-subunit amino acid transport system ATPase component
MLKVKNIYKNFKAIKALRGVSLTAKEGWVTGLIGPNGSGKTTLFNIITGFCNMDEGNIFFKDENINNLPSHAISNKGLCRTFQLSKVVMRMTVLENMLMAGTKEIDETVFAGLFHRNQLKKELKKNIEKAVKLLELVNLTGLANDYAGNLSGGQRKLLVLIMVLMKDPKLVLLDEPTSGVNPTLGNSLIEFINKLRIEKGLSFLIIEHNMKVISKICDMVYVLDAGQIICEGKPLEVQKNDKVLQAYLGRSMNDNKI